MDVLKSEDKPLDEKSKEELHENDLPSEKDHSPKKTKILQIAHVLQQKFIYITGAKDKEGHPLLICEQGTQAEPVTEEVFKDTLTFIIDTANILWDNSKFLVIIDRQNGKWSGVKMMLEYLEHVPEKLLHQILILKPQGFLQRHFSSNDPKQIMKISKHMVVLLDGMTMLEEYIDLSQLPKELGGFNNFDIMQWVEYTTAIERFQVTCKKIYDQVKELQKLFHRKVALASVDEVNTQSKQQFQLVEAIRDDIHCTIEIADTLSPILNKPLSHNHRVQSPLDKYNCAQLQVCSDNLVLYSTDIEKLWLERQTYFEQARELCMFEEEYAKVSIALLQITSILQSRTDIGDTLPTAKELMGELDDFERKKKGSYDSMMKLKEKGLSMVAVFGPFAHESIRLRLNEIKILIKDFEVKLESRRNLLQISLDVFECLDKLETWCKDGVDLLAAQPVEAFNTEDGAKACLNQLDTFMKNGQGINMKKMNQLNMLCKKLSNEMIDGKLKAALNRIEEVKQLLEKREASLKKVAVKPVRPVQAVKALMIDDDTGKNSPKTTRSPTSPMVPKVPALTVNKEEIEIVVTDNIENYKRNKTFRKSLRMSMKRPVSSPAQLQMAEYGEDPEHRKKIRQVITELINTEHDYVNDLRTVIEGYVVPFDNTNYDIPSHVRSQKEVVFGNIEEIYKFHHGTFLQQLEACKNAPYLVGQVFMGKKDELQFYATYCKNKPKSEELRKLLHNTLFLIECQKRLGHQLNLDSYMLKPVQRITKYRLLLTEILKYVSKRNPAHVDIMDALHMMKKVLRHVNDVMHSSGLIGFEGNLDEQGKLILQDAFTVWESKKNAIKKFTKLGSMHRQLFLFEKCLILSKREFENGKDLGTYQCKRTLRTADIGVTETVKGDVCKFEVWVHGRSEVYILQAENVDVKNNWLTEIRKILMSQFEGVKDSLTRKTSTDDLDVQATRDMVQQKLKSLDHCMSGSSPNLLESSAYTNTENLKSSSVANLVDTVGASDGSSWSDSEFEDEELHDDANTLNQHAQPPPKGATNMNDGVKSPGYVTEFPAENTEIGVNTFTAIADYEAVEEFEISFESGSLINLIKEGENGWWFCKNLKTGKEGWAPSGYLELYAVDVSEVFDQSKKSEPVKPSAPSPRRRLETAV